MTTALHTPFDFSDAVSAGRRRFWKQILPVTKINYKGQRINFDKKFHVDLANSFRDEAFDQVPIVFADGENRHNMNPRNFGGDVLDMQVRPDGLYGLIEADEEAAKAIEKNPKLGVSARIRQGIEKADGRKYTRAIEHVLLTMNPRVTKMSPWQAVDLSDEDTDIEVVDLTAETYQEGKGMATKAKRAASTSNGKIDLSNLSDDEFQTLLDLAQAATADPEEDLEEDLEEDEDLEQELEDPRTLRPKRKKSKTKIVVEKESEDDGDEEDDEEDEDETNLSDADKVIRRGEVSQFQQMRVDLAEERWGRDRTAYTASGVPPFLLDLAEPVLSLPDALVIDLSDDEQLNASETVRKMLDGIKGVIDLGGEIGHMEDIDLTDDSDDADAFLEAWDQQYG